MGPYFSVDADFWTDADVIDNFTPEDKYFYLYLLTSPHGNISGCFEVSLKQIASEMGYSKDSIEHLVDRFVSVHKMIDYDAQNKEILVHKWGKHHWTRSEKYIVALRKKISVIKTEKFRIYLENQVKCFECAGENDMVWIPYQYGMDTTFLSFPLDIPLDSNNKENSKGNISPQDIVDLFNEICVSLSKVRILSENRRKAIKARMAVYSADDFRELFEKAEASKFLKGGNDRNWAATFDWLITDRNMARVLDGNYDDRGSSDGNNRGTSGKVSGSRWNIVADVG